MTSMSISLPEEVKAFVDEQVAKGGYSTASEYVGALLREAQTKAAQERLDALLIQGLESGPSTPMTKEDWQAIRHEGLQHLASQERT